MSKRDNFGRLDGLDAANMEIGHFAAQANGRKRFAPVKTSRRATTGDSPQFQLRVVMSKTDQAPAGRQTDDEGFGRPSGTGFYWVCETRS